MTAPAPPDGTADDGDGSVDEAQPIHPAPTSFVHRYLFSIDHKVIARQFLCPGLVFLAVGGALAMLIRWQLAIPGQPVPLVGKLLFRGSGGVITPAAYTTLFTMHGLIMIFFAITPILIGGFGNFCIPLMIGARDMAFPRLNMLSFWTLVVVDRDADRVVLRAARQRRRRAGRPTRRCPPRRHARLGPDAVVGGHLLTGASTIMGAVNYVTTVIRLRAPGMTYMRMPLTVWGLWLTAILNVLFVPVLGGRAVLLFFDRVFGTQFFIAGARPRRRRPDPLPAPVLDLRPPRGLHPDPAGLGLRRRPAVVLRAQAGLRVQGHGRRR